MIYTRCGAPVQLITAEMRMKDMPCGDRAPVWFCKAKMTGPYPDGSGKAGEPLFDGGWFEAGADLRADNGWGEIEDACEAADQTSNALSPF